MVNSLKSRYERMRKMKLLLCEHCHDIFKPGLGTFRSCQCGRVSGRYINDKEAEVSAATISIGIDGHSLAQAIADMKRHRDQTGNTASEQDYYKPGNGAINYVWVRPNTGPGNPHTRIIEGEEQGTLDKRYLRMPLPVIHKDKVTPKV